MRIWTNPNGIAAILLFVTFLAGGFSLHRVDDDLRSLGELAFARSWLLLASVTALLTGRRAMSTTSLRLGDAAAFARAVSLSQFYMALTALWSDDAKGTLPRVFSQIFLIVLLELSLLTLRRDPAGCLRVILGGSLWAALLFAAAGFAGGSELGRMAMFFGGPNVFIRVIAGGILAAVYRTLATRRLRWLVPVPLLLVCAVESGSRGGILAMFLTLPALAWAVGTSGVLRQRPGWWLTVPLSAALALTVTGLYVVSRRDVRDYVEQRYLVYGPHSYDPAEADFGNRDRLFAAALEAFWSQPVWGSGLSRLGELEAPDAHPHNLFLATARDGGIVGLALLAIPFALLAARLRRPIGLEQRMAVVLGFFFLCASQFSGAYYDCRFIWLYFLAAMLPHNREDAPDRPARPGPARILPGARRRELRQPPRYPPFTA